MHTIHVLLQTWHDQRQRALTRPLSAVGADTTAHSHPPIVIRVTGENIREDGGRSTDTVLAPIDRGWSA